jgi:hypothetical protein
MSKELAADYFARHSNDECHITSDGRVFHTKGSADSFANGLKDNTVVSFTRDGKKEEKKEEAPGSDATVFTLEDLKAFDTTTASYAEIKALANGLNLESASQKKEDLLAAIEAQKVIINTEVQD